MNKDLAVVIAVSAVVGTVIANVVNRGLARLLGAIKEAL